MITAKKKQSRKVTAGQTSRRKTLKLPADIRIQTVEQIKDNLSTLLQGYKIITLDASSVTKIDCIGAQLLAAFCSTAKNQSIDVRWKAPSEQFIQASNLLDIKDTLNLSNTM